MKIIKENMENVDIDGATPVEPLATAGAKQSDKKSIDKIKKAAKDADADIDVNDKGYITGKFEPKETKKVSTPDLKKMKLSEELFEDVNSEDIAKFNDVVGNLQHGGVYTADDDGAVFYIVDGWSTIKDIYDAMGWERSDEYDTDMLDEITEGRWGFSDSYAICDHCGKLIQTEPDSYSWKPDFYIDYEYGDITCGDCVREDPANYLESLINNPESANTILSSQDLMDEGFERVNAEEFESGWYGRNDSPKEILSNVLDKYPDAECVFSIAQNQQFATMFDLWIRGVDLESEDIEEGIGTLAKTGAVFVANHWKEILDGLQAAGVAYETIKEIADKIKAEEAKKKPQEPAAVKEGIEETTIRRYSDVVPQEDRKYWYFTTHGVGPGTIPKDLHVLEVKYDLPNDKGTIGDYVCLDGVLNTSELEKYDMRELAPRGEITTEELNKIIDESEEFVSDKEYKDAQNTIKKYEEQHKDEGLVDTLSGAFLGSQIGGAMGHPIIGAVAGGVAGGENIIGKADDALHTLSGIRNTIGSGPISGVSPEKETEIKDDGTTGVK